MLMECCSLMNSFHFLLFSQKGQFPFDRQQSALIMSVQYLHSTYYVLSVSDEYLSGQEFTQFLDCMIFYEWNEETVKVSYLLLWL